MTWFVRVIVVHVLRMVSIVGPVMMHTQCVHEKESAQQQHNLRQTYVTLGDCLFVAAKESHDTNDT